MRNVRITSKGQITVPKKLRDRFGITPQSELEFRDERGRLVLAKKATKFAIVKVRGRVRRLPIGSDVDEYLRLTRGDGKTRAIYTPTVREVRAIARGRGSESMTLEDFFAHVDRLAAQRRRQSRRPRTRKRA